MRIAPKSNPAAPYPGLDKEKFFFDTDQDMLDLTDVSCVQLCSIVSKPDRRDSVTWHVTCQVHGHDKVWSSCYTGF
jgi:hypothetical protein